MSSPEATSAALRVAIVGAESTGKSSLAQALARRLGDEFGLRCVRIDEFLREWCDVHARTPRADEQRDIALEHQRRIDAAAARPDVDLVLCDTTPLMISVYSELLFDDTSIDAIARPAQQSVDLTLLTALDLPWVADGLMRDGPHVRAPVDALVRRRLADWRVDWSLVTGRGESRVDHALDALRPPLLRRARDAGAGRRLFGRLADAAAAAAGAEFPPRPAWRCERCDDPACEHLARRAAAR